MIAKIIFHVVDQFEASYTNCYHFPLHVSTILALLNSNQAIRESNARNQSQNVSGGLIAR